MAHYVLDVKRLLCPLPVIRLDQKTKLCTSGDTILVCATDKGVLSDIPAWSRIHGHSILQTAHVGSEFHVTVLVK